MTTVNFSADAKLGQGTSSTWFMSRSVLAALLISLGNVLLFIYMTRLEDQVPQGEKSIRSGNIQSVYGREKMQNGAAKRLGHNSAEGGGTETLEMMWEKGMEKVMKELTVMRKIISNQEDAMKEQLKVTGQLKAAVFKESLAKGGAIGSGDLTFNTIEEDDPSLWQQRSFRRHSVYGFISYSAYRVAATRIAVLGIGALGWREARRIGECSWTDGDGISTTGKLSVDYMEEHHNYLYEFIMFQCSFEDGPKESGGHLKMVVDNEVFYPFREEKNEMLDDPDKFAFNLAICGSPLFGEVVPNSVVEWLDYHRFYTRIDHAFLYDTGISKALMNELKPYIDAGVVSIADLKDGYRYMAWAQNQALAMHDCLYRNRRLSKWVMYLDIDEYLEVPPPRTFAEILKTHEDKVWISHGSYVFSTMFCEGGKAWAGEKYAVEVMLQRQKHIFCIGNFDPQKCPTFYGYRKLIANPRKLELVYVHMQGRPEEGGVDMAVDELRHMHYQSVSKPGFACRVGKDKIEDYLTYTNIASIGTAARLCAKKGLKQANRCGA